MELREPKRKKYCTSREFNSFPVTEINDENKKYIGVFTGISVEIFDPDTIKCIYDNGCFGKGSFSRSVPNILRSKKLKTMKEHQYINRLEMAEKFGVSKDEEPEDSEYFKIIPDEIKLENEKALMDIDDIEPQQTRNPFVIKEALVLSLEEAFFLHYSLKCLEIRDLDNKPMSTNHIWIAFCSIKNKFISCFVVYQYLRHKNWVVKSGLKFGGEFLLYKMGPRFYHASFVVSVNENFSNKDKEMKDLQALYRISETSGKDLLMIDVYYPSGIDKTNISECLQRLPSFEISEHTLKRFIFQQERDPN